MASGKILDRLKDEELRRVVEFHGHLCPGLVLGVRATRIALRELGVGPSFDEELVGVVETNACGADALQVLAGCTFGKGNLVFRDWGKNVYTLIRRPGGEAVRVALKADSSQPKDSRRSELRDRVTNGEASPEEVEEFWRRSEELALKLMEVPAEELFTFRHGKLELPPEAEMHEGVVCEMCREPVMDTRTLKKGGRILCIPCSGRES